MKYCRKCGNPMEDDTLFCQKCGTKATEQPSDGAVKTQEEVEQRHGQTDRPVAAQPSIEKPRKGMKVLAILCLVFAGIYALMSIGTPFLLSVAVFFGILAVMFFVLAKSPKGNPFLFGKAAGLKKPIFVLICVIVAFASVGIIGSQVEPGGLSNDQTPSQENSEMPTNDADDSSTEERDQIVVDVTQFANISGEELIALLGEPDSIEGGTCTGAFEIPCTYYYYFEEETMGNVSFALVNDGVVRLTSYNEYEYADGESNLLHFGIEKGEDCTKVGDTGTALRYRCPSEAVDDLWINLIEDDVFGFLQVTYNMMWYEEWYLPMDMSEKSNYQYWTQETVKSLLKAPKSADFPGITDWTIVANPFYVAVQSYVDAQNSFGAEVRSEFTFIYFTGTNEIIYAVFDGQVIADNGYMTTADLVSLMASEEAQAQ